MTQKEENHVITRKHSFLAIARNEDVPAYLKGKIERGRKDICQKNTKGGQ